MKVHTFWLQAIDFFLSCFSSEYFAPCHVTEVWKSEGVDTSALAQCMVITVFSHYGRYVNGNYFLKIELYIYTHGFENIYVAKISYICLICKVAVKKKGT